MRVIVIPVAKEGPTFDGEASTKRLISGAFYSDDRKAEKRLIDSRFRTDPHQ